MVLVRILAVSCHITSPSELAKLSASEGIVKKAVRSSSFRQFLEALRMQLVPQHIKSRMHLRKLEAEMVVRFSRIDGMRCREISFHPILRGSCE